MELEKSEKALQYVKWDLVEEIFSSTKIPPKKSHIYTYVYLYIHTDVFVHICIYLYTQTYIHVSACILFLNIIKFSGVLDCPLEYICSASMCVSPCIFDFKLHTCCPISHYLRKVTWIRVTCRTSSLNRIVSMHSFFVKFTLLYFDY